jgi:hypothetical protein
MGSVERLRYIFISTTNATKNSKKAYKGVLIVFVNIVTFVVRMGYYVKQPVVSEVI